VLITAFASTSVSAAAPGRGFMAAGAHPLGYSLTELATAWTEWGFSTGEDNPLLAVRCEQSQLDPRIWFLPVSLGGDFENTCDVPPGSFLVLFAGGNECSSVEAPPFFGSTEEELRACVDATLATVTHIEVSGRGQTTTDLDSYLVTTDMINLPANNLLSADPGISMTEGWFLVIGPQSPGSHTFRAYDEFSTGFTAGITYTINVG
jgi:hypothetical protein